MVQANVAVAAVRKEMERMIKERGLPILPMPSDSYARPRVIASFDGYPVGSFSPYKHPYAKIAYRINGTNGHLLLVQNLYLSNENEPDISGKLSPNEISHIEELVTSVPLELRLEVFHLAKDNRAAAHLIVSPDGNASLSPIGLRQRNYNYAVGRAIELFKMLLDGVTKQPQLHINA